MNIRLNKYILFFIAFSSVYVKAEVISEFQRCLRFNKNHMIDDVSIHSTVNLEGEDWISINKVGSMFYFFADNDNENIETKETKEFGGNWPTPEASLDPDTHQYEPQMAGHIYCQWDLTNGTPIKVDQTITNHILRSYNGIQMENDVDIYSFIPSNSVYCIELKTDSLVRMSICLNMSDFSNVTFKETFNVLTGFDGLTKRYYKDDWIVGETYYIKLYYSNSNDYYKSEHNYIFTIKNVQPIILVHGIRSGPIDSTKTNTAFSIIKDRFPYAEDLCPTVFYDFPWDPESCSYIQYVGRNRNNLNILYGYAYDICSHCELSPVVISHSIGGILTVTQVKQENEFKKLIKSFVFFGTPFCGADAASYPGVGYFSETHPDNLYFLKRGTKNVWDYLSEIPSSLFDCRSTFFIGTNPKLKITYKRWSKEIYGGIDCDGVTSISSANLPETLEQTSEHIKVRYNHKTMKELSFPLSGDYEIIYNTLKNHIGQNHEN